MSQQFKTKLFIAFFIIMLALSSLACGGGGGGGTLENTAANASQTLQTYASYNECIMTPGESVFSCRKK